MGELLNYPSSLVVHFFLRPDHVVLVQVLEFLDVQLVIVAVVSVAPVVVVVLPLDAKQEAGNSNLSSNY